MPGKNVLLRVAVSARALKKTLMFQRDLKDERETEGRSPTTEAERGRRRIGEGKVTAGERALLQSVRARREKGWGKRARREPPTGRCRGGASTGGRWGEPRAVSGRPGCWSSCCGDWIPRCFLATP